MWTVREIEQRRRGIGRVSLRKLATLLGTPFLREVENHRATDLRRRNNGSGQQEPG